MVTREQARDIVARELGHGSDPEDPWVITDVEERSACFVLYYTLQSAIEADPLDPEHWVLGNGPYIVEKATGRAISTPTALSINHYVRAYERVGDPLAAHGSFPCTLHLAAAKKGVRRWAAQRRLVRSGLVGLMGAWKMVSRVIDGETASISSVDYRKADELARDLVRMWFDVSFSAGVADDER